MAGQKTAGPQSALQQKRSGLDTRVPHQHQNEPDKHSGQQGEYEPSQRRGLLHRAFRSGAFSTAGSAQAHMMPAIIAVKQPHGLPHNLNTC